MTQRQREAAIAREAMKRALRTTRRKEYMDDATFDHIVTTVSVNLLSVVDIFDDQLTNRQKRRVLKKASSLAVRAIDRREGA